MGSVGSREIGQSTSSEAVVDFGNGAMQKEIVTYKGVKMERQEARRINSIINDLGYLAYRAVNASYAGNSLSEQEIQEQERLQNELRRYRDKYGISVGRYLPGGK